jgi:hypothetical protein
MKNEELKSIFPFFIEPNYLSAFLISNFSFLILNFSNAFTNPHF